MKNRFIRLSLLLLLGIMFSLPAFAGQDSTKVEKEVPIGFNKEQIKDDVDLLLLIEYGAIWDPLSLEEEPSQDGYVRGCLSEDGYLELFFGSDIGQSQVKVYRHLLPVATESVSGLGETRLPLGRCLPGRYTVLVLPEEDEGLCYVGRFRIE